MLNRYRITYRDAHDPGSPIFHAAMHAHDSEHAERRFFDSDDSEGWEILKIEKIDVRAVDLF